MHTPLVVMGVAGCGKSSVAQQLSAALGWRLIEGDDFHSDANRERMRAGVALTDQDRAAWLATLAGQLAQAGEPLLLTCSALKKTYRDQLRAGCPQLRFLFLRLTPEAALARVAQRPGHFFSPSLVHSQFQALEDPSAEPGVLALDATAPLEQLRDQVLHWLRPEDAKETP